MINDVSTQLINLLFVFKKNFLKQHSEVGVSVLSLLIFRIICDEGEIRISDIASRIKISVPTVTEYISKLEHDNIVVKITIENDKREKFVKLTKKGRMMKNNHMKKLKKSIQDKLSILSDEDLIALNQSLSSVVDILNKI